MTPYKTLGLQIALWLGATLDGYGQSSAVSVENSLLFFTGNVGFQNDPFGGAVNITADRVDNDYLEINSDTLKIKMWATAEPYAGGTLTGWMFGEVVLGSLNAKSFFGPIEETVALAPPPDGTYFITMTLTEFFPTVSPPFQDVIVDYVTFSSFLIPITRTFFPLPIVGLPLGDNWYFSDWYGIYNTSIYPWIFHSEHRFQYVLDSSFGGFFLYDLNSADWWWTASLIYPTFYSFNRDAFIFYFTDTSIPRQFVNLNTGEFFSFE